MLEHRKIITTEGDILHTNAPRNQEEEDFVKQNLKDRQNEDFEIASRFNNGKEKK